MASIAIDRLDGLSSSAAIKGPVKAATTANITLSGEQTIDGVAIVDGDRVLVKDQTTGSENGIYVADTGPWRRSKDFNRANDVRKGTMVFVNEGSLHQSTMWSVTSEDPIVVGTDTITFSDAVLFPQDDSVGPDKLNGDFLVFHVATRTDLKALDTTRVTTAYLKESGREGIFRWTTGNYSSQIASDTLEGVYIKADAIASSAGAWVRSAYLEGNTVDVRWFGAPLNGTSADDAAFALSAELANAQVTYNSFYGQQSAPVKAWVGYTAINADWSILQYTKSDVDGNMRLAHTLGNDSQVQRAEVFSGLRSRYLALRYRLNTADALWDGSVYWETAGHSYSNSFRKFIPTPSVGVWTEIVMDMWAPAAGGTDWRDNQITSIRIDFLADTSPDATVDWAFAKLCEEALPNPNIGTVRIPYGTVKLAQNVDTAGRDINWVIDSGVKFADDCAVYLPGRTSRPNRINLRRPHGRLDSAAGYSVQVGDGYFGYAANTSDIPSQVTGFLTPSDASVYLDTGSVGFQADIAGSPVITVASPTYALTGASWATAIDTTQVRVGDEVRTLHTPAWRSVITSIASDGKSITVPAWYQLDDTTKTPGTPPSTQNMIINPLDKVWAANFNTFIMSSTFTYQSAVVEAGLYNSKTVPAGAEDGSGRTWGYDIVNLGPNKGSIGFIQRGSFFEGYRAAGADIGFRAAAYVGLGLSAPSVGFQYTGSGVSFSHTDTSGRVAYSVSATGVEIGTQGVAQTTVIDMHSASVATDFDARISVSGGGPASSAGDLLLQAGTIKTDGVFSPVADNSFSNGTASLRWSVVYAATGTINTSDPKLKRFADSSGMDAEWSALRRVMARLRENIKLYQWLDAIYLKGDDARWHIGLNAEQVLQVCDEEGIDARRYGFFCEDDLFEVVQVIDELPVQEMEEVEQEVLEEVEEADRVVVRKVTKTVNIPKVIRKPMFDEFGEPILVDRVWETQDGNLVGHTDDTGKFIPSRRKVQAEAVIPVMTTKEVVRYENRPVLGYDGKAVKRLALRYDQILLAMLATA